MVNHVNTLKLGESTRRYWLALSTLIVAFDQLSKYVSTYYLTLGNWVEVFPGFRLALRHNTGAAFSFLSGASGWQRWFFIGLALIASTAIYVWLGRVSDKSKSESLGLALILGGALGNLLDRIAHGYVIDFILVYYKEWYWPAFNIADSAICIGVTLLIPSLFKKNDSGRG